VKKNPTLALILLGASAVAAGLAYAAADAPAKPAAPAKSGAAAPAAAKDVNPGVPAKGPRIVVEPEAFDFGKALQQKTLTKEFNIRNLGTEELVIGKVSTTCGCTAAVPGEKTIKPGGSTPLHVELQTRTNTGKIERTVLVETNDPMKAVYEVKVQADVVAEQAAPQ
jgi:hypothetical protein